MFTPVKPFKLLFFLILLTANVSSAPRSAGAQNAGSSSEGLSKQISNPVSSLISIPFQFNFDDGLGAEGDAGRYLLNIQPVIPFSLNPDWSLITRVILPVVYVDSLIPGVPGVLPADDHDFGLGDTLASFFFSPKQPTNGIIWGVGPAINLPTATNSEIGSGKWGAGPTAVVLTQQSGWTVGILANHIWSFGGDEDRDEINQTFMQPFISHSWKSGFTLTLNSEATYNWQTDEPTIPVNLVASQIVKFGSQNTQLFLGGRVYAERPEFGPDWGIRSGITFLFPE